MAKLILNPIKTFPYSNGVGSCYCSQCIVILMEMTWYYHYLIIIKSLYGIITNHSACFNLTVDSNIVINCKMYSIYWVEAVFVFQWKHMWCTWTLLLVGWSVQWSVFIYVNNSPNVVVAIYPILSVKYVYNILYIHCHHWCVYHQMTCLYNSINIVDILAGYQEAIIFTGGYELTSQFSGQTEH